MNEVTKSLPLADFVEPDGIVRVRVDAHTGMKPGAGTEQTVNEIFIDGTQPTKSSDMLVSLEIDKATGDLWQEGCEGPMEEKSFLDLSGVESSFPQWAPYNAGWIKRAMKGSGVRGGPENTATSYFYESGGWVPFGASWGAPMPPTKKCEPAPTPTEDPFATDFPFPVDSGEPFPFPTAP
jgi:hypothetical protein